MSVWIRERRREERDHNILLPHSLSQKSFFPNCHSAVPAQGEGCWDKDRKAMRRKRKRQEERGVGAAGSVGDQRL